MKDEKIIVILYLHKQNRKIDIEIPLDITANELIIGLTQGFQLEMDLDNLSKCFLKTENPIALLRGNHKLSEYDLRNGTVINYTL